MTADLFGVLAFEGMAIVPVAMTVVALVTRRGRSRIKTMWKAVADFFFGM